MVQFAFKGTPIGDVYNNFQIFVIAGQIVYRVISSSGGAVAGGIDDLRISVVRGLIAKHLKADVSGVGNLEGAIGAVCGAVPNNIKTKYEQPRKHESYCPEWKPIQEKQAGGTTRRRWLRLLRGGIEKRDPVLVRKGFRQISAVRNIMPPVSYIAVLTSDGADIAIAIG